MQALVGKSMAWVISRFPSKRGAFRLTQISYRETFRSPPQGIVTVCALARPTLS